ncbi:MAG: 4Fe-4S binding protein [Methanomicrobiales archaeon]|nr:4Fe-4S binding protein [Methanomicrobiales archaeon]
MPAGPSGIQFVGIAYGLIFTIIGAILWYKGIFSTRLKYTLLIVTLVFGFAIFSPMLPFMFQELVATSGGGAGASIAMAAAGMSAFFALALLFGRHFCGYLCPIGAVQELAFLVQVPKVKTPWKKSFLLIRGAVFIHIVISGVAFSFSLLGFLGVRQFFTLHISAGFLVFLAIIAVALFVYRPFCRIVCPIGAIFYIFAAMARWKIRRTGSCIECKTCERACPVSEAGREDAKGECYLCRRCIDACPVKGALVYGSSGKADTEIEK